VHSIFNYFAQLLDISEDHITAGDKNNLGEGANKN